MSKELDALERLYIAGDMELEYVMQGKQKDDYAIIENALKEWEIWKDALETGDYECPEKKALEIIKEKFVNITILMGCESLEEYNKHPLTMRKGRLSQEEYDLLKEVFL